jgi:hypothetical protein
MSHYGIILPQFWRGETGREIRTNGGKDAQLTALYLMSCHSATMIGLYALPLRELRSDTGIGLKGLVRAFTALTAVGYAEYDARTEHVWVREMAKIRLQLDRAALDPKDNRVKGAQRLYEKLIENPFLEPFFDRYALELHLIKKRRCGRAAQPLLDVALPKGLKGLSKGLQKPVTDIRDQVPGIRDQGIRDQVDQDQNLPPLSRRPVQNLLKTQTGKNGNAPPSQSRGVAAALRDRETDARAGSDERRRGMESADPQPLGQIGFHGSGSPDAEPGDVGGGTGAREAARPAADPGAEHTVTAAADGRPTEPPGVDRVQGAPGVARDADRDANHGEALRRVEPHARADTRMATGARAEGASGEPSEPLDQNGEGVETPGQAKLRLAIAELKRKLAR